MLCLLFFSFFTSAVFTQQDPATLQMPHVFSDNMVLQQGIHASIWGSAKKGDKVTVEMVRTITEAFASESDGSWMVKLPVLPAGGPYEMKVTAGREVLVFHNVMIGEVWVASGQSNMGFTMPEVRNAFEEMRQANYPGIRFIRVDNNISNYPLQDISGTWKQVDSLSVRDISAVAYFFARQLHREKQVPVGIIFSAWGGTPIEAWTSADMLSVVPEFRDSVDLYKQRKDDWLSLYKNYLLEDARTHQVQEGIAKGVEQVNYTMHDWKKATFPMNVWSMQLGYYGGFIWLRKPFDIPEKRSPSTLHLKNVTGDLELYMNGKPLPKPTVRENELVYNVEAKLLKKGKNLLAMRQLSFWGTGKAGNEKNDITLVTNDGREIVLDGEWFFNENIELKFPELPAQKNYPTALYNAMIAPVIPYGIKGVIWYQGENNAWKPLQYRTLFPLLINDWRIRWQEGSFPFLFVQLANFGPRNTEPVSDNWALLREAQTMALNYPNTGMAVTIDIGDASNIHPKNKQDVGKRLYLAARKVAYHEDVVYSGPMYDSMQVQGDKIRISFTHTGSGLVIKGDTLKGFAIAGEDKKFFWADAIIEGKTVVVGSDKVKHPVAVRYGWSTNPACNLYNKEELPASPFRTDEW